MKKITYLSQTFSDYRSFEQEFKTVFSKEKPFPSSKHQYAQNFHEQFMCKHLDNTSLQTPCVIVFLTVKNLLAESTYLNIMEKTVIATICCSLGKRPQKTVLKN